MQAFGITVLILITAGSAPADPAAPGDNPALEETAAAGAKDALDEEIALEVGSEADFFAEEEDQEGETEEGETGEEEEEVVFADDGETELAQTDAPAFGAAFPEHDPRRWLLLLPLALLALFTLNVRWRTPSK